MVGLPINNFRQTTATLVRIVFYAVMEHNNTNTNSGGSIYIQDAQLEQGLVARDYIETTTAAVEGGITDNVPRLDYTDSSCPALLLEPQRTNLVEYTEFLDGSFWIQTRLTTTPNATTSPEGVDNAYKIVTNNGENVGYIYNTDSVTSGTTYTTSFFIKEAGRQYTKFWSKMTGSFKNAVINLSTGDITNSSFATLPVAESFGDGWWRVSYTQTAGAGGTIPIYIDAGTTSNGGALVGDGTNGVYVWGAQLEQGSYPTSYIPNHSGGSVTRLKEKIVNTSLNSFIDTSNPYTIFFDFTRADTNYTSAFQIIGIDNGSYNSRLKLQARANVFLKQFFVNIYDGTTQVNSSYIDNSGQHKIAIVYDGATSYKIFRNGAEFETLTLGAINGTRFVSGENGNQYTIETHNQILLFPTALSDADCITLTTL